MLRSTNNMFISSKLRKLQKTIEQNGYDKMTFEPHAHLSYSFLHKGTKFITLISDLTLRENILYDDGLERGIIHGLNFYFKDFITTRNDYLITDIDKITYFENHITIKDIFYIIKIYK